MTTYQEPIDIDAEGGAPRFAVITDAALDSLRRLIGVPIADTVEPWCYEVTRDNVRHYAHGIGDDNPLWCDPAYAAGARYGAVTAPPSFVFALSRILSGYVGGLPGIHAMWAGADLTWHRPMPVGTEVRTTAYLKDLVEHQTRFAGRAIQQIYHVDFADADGVALAGGDSWCFRTERDTARELGDKYDEAKSRPPMHYGEAELREIFDLYEAEAPCGAEPRCHDDVASDWLRITGRVTGTGVDEQGRAVVHVEQEARNQHGDLSVLGAGTVALPARSGA